jgi:hypothetical protein
MNIPVRFFCYSLENEEMLVHYKTLHLWHSLETWEQLRTMLAQHLQYCGLHGYKI